MKDIKLRLNIVHCIHNDIVSIKVYSVYESGGKFMTAFNSLCELKMYLSIMFGDGYKIKFNKDFSYRLREGYSHVHNLMVL